MFLSVFQSFLSLMVCVCIIDVSSFGAILFTLVYEVYAFNVKYQLFKHIKLFADLCIVAKDRKIAAAQEINI